METARDGWMDGASGACNWKSSVLSQIFRQHVVGRGMWDVGQHPGTPVIALVLLALFFLLWLVFSLRKGPVIAQGGPVQ